MVDFFDKYQKDRYEVSQQPTSALPPETGFFAWLVIKLFGGVIRNSEDALRILFAVSVVFLLASIYFFYRSQTSTVYEYLPENFQKK
jgi:hypothetical protein